LERAAEAVMISKVRVLGLGAWATTLVLVASCGSSVIGATGSAATGTGGSDTTGTGGAGGCSNPCACTSPTCCAECDATTGPGGFSSTSTGFGDGGSGPTGTGGAGGGGAVCGGFAGFACAPNDYCVFSDHQCGDADGTGACTPLLTGCGKNFEPVCGCDHMVYDNPCEAGAAGVDLDDLGGCMPPEGMFGCGSGFCQIASAYCQFQPSGTSNGTATFTCEPLPDGCEGVQSCACLAGVPCGSNCATTLDGDGVEVACASG
jgi:hypothetical protein